MKGTGELIHAAARAAISGGGLGLAGRRAGPEAAKRPVAAPPDSAGRGGGVTRVLIVDDGASAREGLCALLATFPEIEVVAAVHDGADAIALASATRPDVVVVDARLPLLDDLAFTRLVKARSGPVRVVILSFCGAYRTAALAAGADAFLVKGGSTEELVRVIKNRGPEPTTVAPDAVPGGRIEAPQP